jgi:hypothetical protein
VVVRNQVCSPGDVESQNRLDGCFRHIKDEVNRCVSVAGYPIEHSCIVFVVVGFQGRTRHRRAVSVHMDKPLGVLMVRVTFMDMLKWRLSKGPKQAHHDAKM